MATKTVTTDTKHAPEQVDRTLRSATRDDLLDMLKQVMQSGTERTFSTGSIGYQATGKVVDSAGVRYQASVILTRIGTKGS